MSINYDLETDLEVEDVASEEEEGYQYDYEEGIDEITEFGNYNPEEAAARWGGMEFDQLVVEMEGLVSRGKKYFFSKKKRVVDAKDIDDLSKYIQDRFPEEISKANEINDRETKIINDATNKANEIIRKAREEEKKITESAQKYYTDTYKKADTDAKIIIEKAQEQAEKLVESHEITRQARERGQQIQEATEKEAIAYRNKVLAECEALREEARSWSSNAVNAGRNFVIGQLSNCQGLFMSNLDNLNKINDSLNEEYHKEMRNLGLDK